MNNFWVCLAVAAGVTYLIRLLPLILVKHRIKNRFIISFLYYIPYAVLAVMTVPAIFTSTGSVIGAAIGFAVAFVFAYFEKSLVMAAIFACLAELITELILK